MILMIKVFYRLSIKLMNCFYQLKMLIRKIVIFIDLSHAILIPGRCVTDAVEDTTEMRDREKYLVS